MSEGSPHSVAASADVPLPESMSAVVGATADLALMLGRHANIAITDPRGNLTCVSEQFCRLTNYAREELLGQNVGLINSGYHPAAFFRDLWATIKVGRVWRGEVKNKAKGGGSYWVELTIVPALNADGTARQFIAIQTEITGRRPNEAQLHLLETCLAGISDIVLITEAEPQSEPGPRIIFVNDAFVRRTGYTREEVIGRSPRLLQGPKTSRAELDRIREALRQWQPVRAELINYTKSGQEFWLELEIVPIADENGWFTHCIAIERDVSERKRAEMSSARLSAIVQSSDDAIDGKNRAGNVASGSRGAEANFGYSTREIGGQPSQRLIPSGRVDGTDQFPLEEEQIRQAQEMEALGMFAGGIAHDVNNILTGVASYAAMARMEPNGNVVIREYLEAITQSVKRAADLLRQILAFGRRQKPERKPIFLRPVVTESLRLLSATLPTTVELTVDLGDEELTVLADETAVHQAVMNLGTNACYAMKDRIGCIAVTLRGREFVAGADAEQVQLKPGRYAVLSVRDTGCGMDALVLRRMFEPFFTTKPSGEGTGLGLAVVRGIMRNHDGAVTATSQPGVGTEFQLYFPVHVGAVAEVATDDGSVPRGHGERILVIDDEEVLVNLEKKLLASLGYEVVGTSRPAEALALVLADPARFALVLTDQTMPGMTGLQLAARLREIRPELPIVLMSGHGQMLTEDHLAVAGIAQFLCKPMTLHGLGTAVRNALVHRSNS